MITTNRTNHNAQAAIFARRLVTKGLTPGQIETCKVIASGNSDQAAKATFQLMVDGLLGYTFYTVNRVREDEIEAFNAKIASLISEAHNG